MSFWVRVVVAPADQPLDGVHRVFRVGNALPLGRLSDQDFTIIGEGDHGRRGASALGIFDYSGLASFHHGNARIRGSKINTNCFTNCFCHDQTP